jgi:hypothetical protein
MATRSRRWLVVALILWSMLTVTACGAIPILRPAKSPAETPTLPPVVRVRATATALPAAPPSPVSATDAPAAAAAATAGAAAPGQAPRATGVFQQAALQRIPWGDRSIYRAALRASEVAVLDRLPGATEYRIHMQVGRPETEVEGSLVVRYTNREDVALQEVYFRLFPNAMGGKMTVSDVTVDGAPATPEYRFDDTALRVPLAAPLPPGAAVELGMQYRIELPEDPTTGYGLLSFSGGVLALDSPYPMIPVYDDEGWNVETPPAPAHCGWRLLAWRSPAMRPRGRRSWDLPPAPRVTSTSRSAQVSRSPPPKRGVPRTW